MSLGGTDLMKIHVVVEPEEIVEILEENLARYVETLDDIRKIHEERTERYVEAYLEWTQKELAGTLTAKEKANKPSAPKMPADLRETYDKYIKMYEVTKAKQVFLCEEYFNKFFLDDWEFIRRHVRHLSMLAMADESAYMAEETRGTAAAALTRYSP
jgi:hypothetical protein